jgi:hypothetical protein
LVGSPLLFFYVYILYKVLAGLILIHSNLHHQNRINPRRGLSPILEAMATKTLREFSAPTVENICIGPALETNNLEFDLKPSLINMVQASLFSGKVHEDASTHLQNFLEIGSTIVLKEVNQDIILLRIFPFSLVGRAK